MERIGVPKVEFVADQKESPPGLTIYCRCLYYCHFDMLITVNMVIIVNRFLYYLFALAHIVIGSAYVLRRCRHEKRVNGDSRVVVVDIHAVRKGDG
jgi:hypothetical protein